MNVTHSLVEGGDRVIVLLIHIMTAVRMISPSCVGLLLSVLMIASSGVVFTEAYTPRARAVPPAHCCYAHCYCPETP